MAIATGGAGTPAWLASAIGGFVAASVSVAGTAGVNPLGSLFGGAFLGGLAGAISPTIFSGLGGNTAAGFSTANFLPAVGSGAITGAITGAVGTGIYGGSFGRNVGFGVLGGAGAATIVYGVGAAWERYWYGKEITDAPSVQKNSQSYESRYSNARLAGVRVFEGGASLPGTNVAVTTDASHVVLPPGLLDGPSENLSYILGHEFFHVEQFQRIPNFETIWNSSVAQFGRTFNPLEILAIHRGSVFSGVPMSPIYNQFGLPTF